MQNKKGLIKVIKREERNRVEPVTPKPATPLETTRDMVSTVSTWVNELHQRRRNETSQAIKTFFSDRPYPSRA